MSVFFVFRVFEVSFLISSCAASSRVIGGRLMLRLRNCQPDGRKLFCNEAAQLELTQPFYLSTRSSLETVMVAFPVDGRAAGDGCFLAGPSFDGLTIQHQLEDCGVVLGVAADFLVAGVVLVGWPVGWGHVVEPPLGLTAADIKPVICRLWYLCAS